MTRLKYIQPAWLTFILSFLFILIPSLMMGQQPLRTYQLDSLPKGERLVSGFIEVPENHDDPEGRKINIAYVVVKAKDSDSPSYPMIFFSGGPGGNTIDPGLIGFLKEAPFTEKRDVILFDQRGIGYSSAMPDMSFDSFEIMARDANEEEELELTKALIREYKQKCEEQGIQPQYYNTFQNAKDVGMLFKHLGYEKYNLFGGSYGTRIARVVQDMFPEYVHTSILDSPAPLSGDFLLQRFENYSLALSRIFEYCSNSAECNKKYPDLENDYFKAISKLKEHPVKVRLPDSTDFYVNAQDGLYLLRRLLYQDNSREMAPEMIQAYIRGEGDIIGQVLQFEYQLTGGLNSTMLLSVERYENFNNDNTAEVISEAYKKYPLIPAKLGYFDAMYQAGMEWHSAYLPLEERKFEMSDIPSLVFVNRYDPVTPPKYGYLFKEKLSKGHLFVLDEGGHGGGNQDCKFNLMMAFMDDPNGRLDTSCLNLYKE